MTAWRQSATQALAAPEEARAPVAATRQEKKRIQELERELKRKDKALAETAALLVLSKKVSAIFHTGGDEGPSSKIARPWPTTSRRLSGRELVSGSLASSLA